MQHRRRGQGGMTALELLLGGVIVTVVTLGVVLFVHDLDLKDRGKKLSRAVQPYHNALVAYALAQRDPLVSSPTGNVTGVGAPLQPTCTELKTLLPALLDYDCTLPEGATSPEFRVTPTPTGCSGTGCDLALSVCGTGQVGGTGDTLEGTRILQAAVNDFGAEAGQSLEGYGDTIHGTGWQFTNPYGNKARTFCSYATYGASTLSKFVTLYDTRDPNFMGNVTLHQSLTVNNSITAGTVTAANSVGTGDATCSYAELTGDKVKAKSPTCVDRVVAEGSTGSIETRTATGSTSVRINDRIAVYNTSGTDAAGVRFSASASELYADQLRIEQAQTVGTACPANTFSRDSAGKWMECVSGTWQYPGLSTANMGDPCLGAFAIDATSATSPLICRNNVYVNLNQALGLVAIIDSMTVYDGTVVPAPTCATGTTPTLIMSVSRFQTPTTGGVARYTYTGSGPWTMSITQSGSAAGGEAVVWRACQYTSF